MISFSPNFLLNRMRAGGNIHYVIIKGNTQNHKVSNKEVKKAKRNKKHFQVKNFFSSLFRNGFFENIATDTHRISRGWKVFDKI